MISGTPTAVTSLNTYNVTGSNTGGNAGYGVVITVNDAPPAFSYPTNPAVYTKGVAITNNVPISTGGAVVSWSISPALPTGLSFDTGTGTISGTPTAITAAANYVVTATNTGGSAMVSVNITVNISVGMPIAR